MVERILNIWKKKKKLFLKSYILKARGQKCSFQKKHFDNLGIQHLWYKAWFSRELLSSFVIIFSMSVFIPTAIKKIV